MLRKPKELSVPSRARVIDGLRSDAAFSLDASERRLTDIPRGARVALFLEGLTLAAIADRAPAIADAGLRRTRDLLTAGAAIAGRANELLLQVAVLGALVARSAHRRERSRAHSGQADEGALARGLARLAHFWK